MIWIVLTVLVVAALVFVGAPLYQTGKVSADHSREIADYRAGIEDINSRIEKETGDTSELKAAKIALQRKLLDHEATSGAISPPMSKPLLLSALLGLSVISGLLYSNLGSPGLTNGHATQQVAPENMSLEQLVEQLETKIKQDEANPEGWILYARTLMTLGRFDDALKAYDRLLVLTNNDDKFVTERASAVKYIENGGQTEPGPSQADIEAAAAMSAEDRAAMVQNMVDGLSAKLEENPDDEQGWIRLLKARKVLGQADLAQEEISRMRDTFAERPETIEQILKQSAWATD